MWLIISVLAVAGVAGLLLAGLLWPMIWQSNSTTTNTGSNAGVRWFSPWWHYWLYVCLPLFSWRHRQRLQYWVLQAGHEANQAETVFAQQCMGFVVGIAIGLGFFWVFGFSLWQGVPIYFVLALAVYWWPVYRLQRHIKQQQQQVQYDFPFMLDLLILSIEAGMGVLSAMQVCVRQLPPHRLRQYLQITLDDLRTGLNREQAFTRFAERTNLDEAHAFVAALQQSLELGGSLAPLLRQQAEQRRQERFLRAEKKALEAPVKMLLPLVTCIFPCTFLVIGYPLVMQLVQGL